MAGVEISEQDLGQVPNESPTIRQDAVMHWATKLARCKGGLMLLAFDRVRYRGNRCGQKVAGAGSLIRSLQCNRRTRTLAESFRPNSAAQGNALLNLNEVALQVLDLLVRYLTSYRRALGNKIFPCGAIT